jgi:HAD superfamily hydrolase (TIGR01509 family)
MSGKKAVIFDFDGVLVNSEVIALAELRKCLAEFGMEFDLSKMIDQFLGASFEDIEAFVHRETGEEPKGTFRENWYARLFDRYSRELSIMPGALDLLNELDARKIEYCIASGGSYRRLNFALEATGLKDRFANRAYSADSVARGKPEPDLFLFAAERLNASPENCLVVEDAVAGVRAATNAGILSLAFVGGGHLSAHRELHSKRLRVAGATAVLEGLHQVLEFIDTPAGLARS